MAENASFGNPVSDSTAWPDIPDIDPGLGDAGTVDLTSGVPQDAGDHWRNLADELPAATLEAFVSDLAEAVKRDRETHEPMTKKLVKGLDLLGWDPEESRNDPFPGASAVHHPLLGRACIEFQARVKRELLPQGGAVEAVSFGDDDPAVADRVSRVRAYGNWLLYHGMNGYQDEFDRTLLYLPLMGSAFRKVYMPGATPTVDLISAPDFVVPYATKSLRSAVRKTQILRLHAHEMRSNMRTGLWRKMPLDAPDEERADEGLTAQLQAKLDRIHGLQRPADKEDERYVVFEVHCVASLEGEDAENEDSPYIVTFCATSRKVLAVRRNWNADDETRAPREMFIHYKFLPGKGFYGIGLFHLLGGLTRTATGALRNLLDSGAVTNTPGGFIDKAARVLSGGEASINPFGFTQVELPPDGKDRNIGNHFAPYPFKGPDGVLFQLLQYVVTAGEDFTSVNLQDLAGAQNGAPVGTAMALLEQKSVIFSSVHARQHFSFGEELALLQRCLKEGLDPGSVAKLPNGLIKVGPEDFDGSVQMVPSSDPAVYSQLQRITMAQAVKQLAQDAKAAGIEADVRGAFIALARAIGYKDAEKLFPSPQAPPPPPRMNPVEQFQAILRMQPVRAYAGQDHRAHIDVLMALSVDPQYVPMLDPQKRMPALEALVCDHAALMLAEQVNEVVGQPLPVSPQVAQLQGPKPQGGPPALPPPGGAPGQPAQGGPNQQLPAELPPDVEFQIAEVCSAAVRLLAQERTQAGADGVPGPGADPAVGALYADVARKKENDLNNAQLKAAGMLQNAQLKREEMANKQQIEMMKLQSRQETEAFKVVNQPRPEIGQLPPAKFLGR